MIFEKLIIIISIFAVFPFDNILDITSFPINEELAFDLKIFYIQYIKTSLFQNDLANNNLLYIKKSGYYEILI